MLRIKTVLAALSLGATGIAAQDVEVRPVMAAYTVAAGSSHMADTYLSPLRCSGWSAALGYSRCQTTPFDNRWQYRLDGRLGVDRADARHGGTTLWGARLELQWGMTRRYALPHGISLAVGPAVEADLGCLYNRANGNNPASAKAAVTLNITGEAAWRTRIGHLPVTLSYRPSAAVAGAFFSPEYDELYYEIYLGNRSGLAHFAWPGNRFKLNNLVALDLHLSNTSLRLGLDASVFSSRVSDITTRITAWRFVIGVSGNWISVKP